MKRKIFLSVSILVFLGSLLMIINSSWLLTHPIFFYKEMPLGTLTTWAGLISMPCILYYGIPAFHPPRSEFTNVFRLINLFIILAAISWGTLSYYLAGNWSFSFGSNIEGFRGSVAAYDVFVLFTLMIVALPIVFLIMFLLGRMISKWMKYKR